METLRNLAHVGFEGRAMMQLLSLADVVVRRSFLHLYNCLCHGQHVLVDSLRAIFNDYLHMIIKVMLKCC